MNATSLRSLHETIKTAAQQSRDLKLSAEDVQTLSAFMDELIRIDVAAFLAQMADPDADAADERAFVEAAARDW